MRNSATVLRIFSSGTLFKLPPPISPSSQRLQSATQVGNDAAEDTPVIDRLTPRLLLLVKVV